MVAHSSLGSIPLDEMIGLTKGIGFALDEISGGKPRRQGVWNRGEDFIFRVGPGTAMPIELQSTGDAVSWTTLPDGVKAQ